MSHIYGSINSDETPAPVMYPGPLIKWIGKNIYMIAADENIYNTEDIKRILQLNNHCFYTRDCPEVILEGYLEWGEDVFEKLRGGFSVAIWDGSKRTFIAARDPAGIKPFFYYTKEDDIILSFASKIKLLFENTGSTANCLGNIKELPPGHFLTHNNSGPGLCSFELKNFFNFSKCIYRDSHERTMEKIRDHVFDTLEKQLSANTDIGVFLFDDPCSLTILSTVLNYAANFCDLYNLGNLKIFSTHPAHSMRSIQSILDDMIICGSPLNCKYNIIQLPPPGLEDMLSLFGRFTSARELPSRSFSEVKAFFALKEASKHCKTIISYDNSEMRRTYESAASSEGINVLLPFSDCKMLQYFSCIPGFDKSFISEAFQDFLPDRRLIAKEGRNTFENDLYMLKTILNVLLDNDSSPLHYIIDMQRFAYLFMKDFRSYKTNNDILRDINLFSFLIQLDFFLKMY